MPQITRNQMLAGMVTCPTIQSATWARKTDKIVKRCFACDKEAARIEKQWICHNPNCREHENVVTVWNDKVAEKGDEVTLQFRYKLNGERGTKNWQPAGGFAFNATTREAAERIKRERGLLQVCKMSETDADDLRATPRMVPVYLVSSWIAGGVEYQVRD